MTARDGERPPNFAELCDEASAPAPAQPNAPTVEAARAESLPTNIMEPTVESTAAVDPVSVESPQGTMIVVPPLTVPTAPIPTVGTGPVTAALAGDAAPTNTLDQLSKSATHSEYGPCLALRALQNSEAAPARIGTAASAADGESVATPLTATGTPSPRAAPAAPATSAGTAVPATPASSENPNPPVSGEAPASTPAVAVARGPVARATPEKSSARAPGEEGGESDAGQKNSLRTGQQVVAGAAEGIGTGTALHGDTMKSGPHFAPRSLPLASDAGRRASGSQGGGDTEFSFAWKGWTNGGGERVSTAAQFSRFTEHPALTVTTPGTASSSAGRVATPAPAAPPAPSYPVDEAALLAPVGAAIERLISRGQDQLSVVVRFEQGGSLSLKLTMRDGGIAAHMQTDLPGLEAALRSAWNSFAQDWNQRGVKLAAPSFGAGDNTDLTAGRDGRHSPQHEGQGHAGEAPSFGSWMGRRAVRSVHHAESDPSGPAIGSKSSRVRTARRGLSTWA